LLSFILSGLPIGLAAGGIAYAISVATMGTLTSLLVAVGLASVPILGPIGIGAVAAAVSTLGLFVYKSVKERDSKQGPNSLIDVKYPIDFIGAYVAKIVFLPVTGLALCDGPVNEDEEKFISGKMEAWGYSSEFVRKTLEGYKQLDIDGVKRDVQNTRNVEGNSKYIKKVTNLRELYIKAYQICKELERHPKQQENPLEKASYLDWLCATLDIPKNVSDP
jgi:uncharacterized membrane protein YebE (DUF533 family)